MHLHKYKIFQMRRELFFQIQIAVVSVICHKNEKFQGISKYGMFQMVCEKSFAFLQKEFWRKFLNSMTFGFLKNISAWNEIYFCLVQTFVLDI